MPHLTHVVRRWLVATGLVVVMAACDAAPSATPSPSPAPAADCAADELAESGIDGAVVDDAGEPLGDILVQLDNGAGFTGSARTAADGRFTAPGVTGTFVLTTVDVEYQSVTQVVTVPCGETVIVELVLSASSG